MIHCSLYADHVGAVVWEAGSLFLQRVPCTVDRLCIGHATAYCIPHCLLLAQEGKPNLNFRVNRGEINSHCSVCSLCTLCNTSFFFFWCDSLPV